MLLSSYPAWCTSDRGLWPGWDTTGGPVFSNSRLVRADVKTLRSGVGIWPLSDRNARLLKSAQLKESQLIGRTMRRYLEQPPRFWYVSGLVLRPQLSGSRAIRVLLSQGIGSWLKSPNIRFPCALFALAYSANGEALLERFNFFRVQNAAAMPDHVPLFALELDNRERFASMLEERGLDLH